MVFIVLSDLSPRENVVVFGDFMRKFSYRFRQELLVMNCFLQLRSVEYGSTTAKFNDKSSLHVPKLQEGNFGATTLN